MQNKINNDIHSIKVDVSQRTRLRSSKPTRIQAENIAWFVADNGTWHLTCNIAERNINKVLNNVRKYL